MFKKFKRACAKDKDKRRMKQALELKQKQFYEFNSKRRAISKIMKNV